jgi:hypothetical protein
MNTSILYIGTISFLLFSCNHAYQIILLYVYNEDGSYRSANLSIFPLIVLIGCTLLLYKKYKESRDVAAEVTFDRKKVLSVIGVVGMVIGLVWLAGDVKYAIDATRLSNEISLLTIEKIVPPLILVAFGVYYGYIFNRNPRT